MRTLAVAAILGLAACTPSGQGREAATAAASPRQCFAVQSVNGFRTLDRDTIQVDVSLRDVYELELFGPCNDVDWANAVGLKTRGGGSFICDATDVDVVAPGPIGPQTCRVSSIRKLTESEVAAARAARR